MHSQQSLTRESRTRKHRISWEHAATSFCVRKSVLSTLWFVKKRIRTVMYPVDAVFFFPPSLTPTWALPEVIMGITSSTDASEYAAVLGQLRREALKKKDVDGARRLQELLASGDFHGVCYCKEIPSENQHARETSGHVTSCWMNEAPWLIPLVATHGFFRRFNSYWRKPWRDLVTEAILVTLRKGELENARWFYVHLVDPWPPYSLDVAAEHGRLEILMYLHAHGLKGHTEQVIELAVRNGHWGLAEWLIQHFPDVKCSVELLLDAIERGQLGVVKALYERDELKNWPHPVHANTLYGLSWSDDAEHLAILNHITSMRMLRYRPDAMNSPVLENEDVILPRAYENHEPFVLTSARKVCQQHGFADMPTMISDFIMGDPTVLHDQDKALDQGWVHWLFHFSPQPDKDMVILAEHGRIDVACSLHNRLFRDGRHECSKYFMSLTMEMGDLELVRRHMLNCHAHSAEDWLYAAVWIGRVDVVDWMCQNSGILYHKQRGIAEDKLHKRRTLFHSLDASFTEVAAQYEANLSRLEAAMDEAESAARQNEFFVGSATNAMDLAAIYKNQHVHAKLKTEGGRCTVSGLYGAIINSHLDIVKAIYIYQPELANWPKIEDGPYVLRGFLEPINVEMLEFFQQERDMRLDSQDLDKAAIRGDLEQVQVICNLDLVHKSQCTAADIAAIRGDHIMFQVLCRSAESVSFTSHAMDGAAEGGHLAVVRYLHKRGAPSTRRALDLAARNGHIEVVKYLFEHRREGCSRWAVYWASASGHEHIVRYLTSQMVPDDVDECIKVAKLQGHNAIVESLEAYQASRDDTRSSSSRIRRRRANVLWQRRFDASPSRVVYCEMERLLWPNGVPSDLQPGVPVPPFRVPVDHRSTKLI